MVYSVLIKAEACFCAARLAKCTLKVGWRSMLTTPHRDFCLGSHLKKQDVLVCAPEEGSGMPPNLLLGCELFPTGNLSSCPPARNKVAANICQFGINFTTLWPYLGELKNEHTKVGMDLF